MKLKHIFQIQSILDGKAIPCDIAKFLQEEYFSESKDREIKYGDMDITHVIRVFMNKDNLEDIIDSKISIGSLLKLIKDKMN